MPQSVEGMTSRCPKLFIIRYKFQVETIDPPVFNYIDFDSFLSIFYVFEGKEYLL